MKTRATPPPLTTVRRTIKFATTICLGPHSLGCPSHFMEEGRDAVRLGDAHAVANPGHVVQKMILIEKTSVYEPPPLAGPAPPARTEPRYPAHAADVVAALEAAAQAAKRVPAPAPVLASWVPGGVVRAPGLSQCPSCAVNGHSDVLACTDQWHGGTRTPLDRPGLAAQGTADRPGGGHARAPQISEGRPMRPGPASRAAGERGRSGGRGTAPTGAVAPVTATIRRARRRAVLLFALLAVVVAVAGWAVIHP